MEGDARGINLVLQNYDNWWQNYFHWVKKEDGDLIKYKVPRESFTKLFTKRGFNKVREVIEGKEITFEETGIMTLVNESYGNGFELTMTYQDNKPNPKHCYLTINLDTKKGALKKPLEAILIEINELLVELKQQ